MAKYLVTSGTIPAPVKVVLYGPEGIGKSTFASQFPDPVFIDTEGGTKRLNVARLPAPTSWQMLMDEVAEVARGNVPCGTLVIDTADWAEKLCMEGVCAKYKVNSIDAFNYGKGYTFAKEEFAHLENVDCLVVNALRFEPHWTHQNVEEALAFAARVGAKETYFTHASHHIGLHAVFSQSLPPHVHMAYDGLEIEV